MVPKYTNVHGYLRAHLPGLFGQPVLLEWQLRFSILLVIPRPSMFGLTLVLFSGHKLSSLTCFLKFLGEFSFFLLLVYFFFLFLLLKILMFLFFLLFLLLSFIFSSLLFFKLNLTFRIIAGRHLKFRSLALKVL